MWHPRNPPSVAPGLAETQLLFTSAQGQRILESPSWPGRSVQGEHRLFPLHLQAELKLPFPPGCPLCTNSPWASRALEGEALSALEDEQAQSRVDSIILG